MKGKKGKKVERKGKDVEKVEAEEEEEGENPYLLNRIINFKPFLFNTPKMIYPI